jgi:hypothetical protein
VHLIEPAVIKNEHNPLVSCLDTAIHGGGYSSSAVRGVGVGAAEAVPSDPRFMWSTGQLAEITDEVVVVGVGCTPRFKAGGDAANAALHRAIDRAVGGRHNLHTLTKKHISVGLGQVGNAYVVPLQGSFSGNESSADPAEDATAVAAAVEGPVGLVEKIHSVIHVLGPNCNSDKPDYVADVGQAVDQLRASYRALFSSYGRVLERILSQASTASPKRKFFFINYVCMHVCMYVCMYVCM